LAYSIGNEKPLVVRAGYGMFYTRIPQIYTSTIATDNGLNSVNLILDNSVYDREQFTAYPNTLASCPIKAGFCVPTYYSVPSFSTWQMTRSMTCPFPPCINPLTRPITTLGAINQFESAASSVYHGATLSVRRRMTNGFYVRLAYTFAHATDDGQDALVAGRPVTVQNSYSTISDPGPSVTDQRHRFALSWIGEPQPFGREHAVLAQLFNHWKISGVVTVGSGRPVDARVFGDPNQEGNTFNDRLPGYGRNAFLGPDYATTDLRLTRRL
jgi:hypothetical protein